VGFNLAGGLEIQGYLQPRNGNSFTADEISMAYLLASRESKELNQDVKACQLLNEFAAPQPSGQDSKIRHQVFTFEKDLPEYLGIPMSRLTKVKKTKTQVQPRCLVPVLQKSRLY
jgi:hypothetical protein